MREKMKVFMYTFMSIEKINKKVEKNGELLKSETDPKKRMDLIRDEFALMKAIIIKNRKDEKFMEYVRESCNKLITQIEES